MRRPSGEWVLFQPNGATLHFATACDACGAPDSFCVAPEAGGRARLVKVVDPRGNAVHLAYARATGLLLGLTDDLGHTLELRSATACTDGLARELLYDGMNVASYAYEGTDLISAIDADGAILRSYAYDPAGSGLLISVLDEAGLPNVEFSYDGDGDATGIVDELTTMVIGYSVDPVDEGTVVDVSESYGTSVSAGQRKFDNTGNLISVAEGCSCGGAKTFSYSGADLLCTTDVSGIVTYDARDALGRVTRHARYSGTACPPSASPLSGSFEEEWRTYGVMKQIAQGVSLELDHVTSVSRTSALSTSNKTTETWDYDPTPKAYDPVGYSCAEAPLPAGAVVCRHIQSGYATVAGAVKLVHHATFYSHDGKGRVTKVIGPVYLADLLHPSSDVSPPTEERIYWSETESLARRGRLAETRRYPSPMVAPLATTYDYDAFGVYRMWEPNGLFTTWIKDGRGRATFVLKSDGTSSETRYHDGEKPRLWIGPAGEVVRTTYDSRGRVTAEERLSGDPDVPGATVSVLWGEYHQYDGAGNRVHSERRDETGAVVWKQDREFDVQHRLLKELHPEVAGAARTWEYEPSGFLKKTVDEEGRATIFEPEYIGRVKSVTRSGLDAAGAPTSLAVATYGYQGHSGELASVVDGKGLATSYAKDDFGRLQTLTTPNLKAGTLTFAYDARGNLLERSDGYVTVSHGYDGLDRLLTTTATNAVDGATVTYGNVYDEEGAVGRLTSVIEPERTIRLGFDAAGRLRTERLEENGVPVALVTERSYDSAGRLKELVYPTGRRVQWVRNPVTHEVVEVKDAGTGAPFASLVTRLPGGPVSGLVFGNGQPLARTFNARQEPASVTSGPVALGYGMTPAGDVSAITEGGSARTFQYDFLDRLTGLDGLESYVHDSNGNRTSERSNGGWSGYLLAGDRVTAIKVPYSYAGCYTDQNTRALPVMLASGGATAKSCTEAARAQGLKYAGLQYYGYCFGGNTLGYAKAGDGECNTPCTANPAEPCGGSYRNTVYSVLGNSEPWAFAYDRQSNVSALAMAPPAPVTAYQGCYADQGTRALPVQLMASGATASTCAAAALAQGLRYAGLQYYGYCFGGNTLQYAKVADSECNTRCSANSAEWCGGSWRNSIYEAVRWTESAATCLRHDPLGRLVLVGSTSPSSVTADGLACTTDAAVTGAAARFKYDFRNRRIAGWRATTNEWVYTVFDQAGQPLAELAKTSDPLNPWRPVREYVWLDGKPIAQIEYDATTGASRAYSVHTDAIGLPRALTSPSGATVWTASVARPYGDITETTTPDPATGKTVVTNLRLPGQYDERLLGTLGLQGPYYNWNRWYLPSAGRYLELDPIAKAGGFNGFYGPNWYGYAEGNPLSWVDVLGLEVEMCHRKFDSKTPPPYARHCFLRFDGNNFDTLSFDRSGVHKDPYPNKPGRKCTPVPKKDKDDCIRREMKRCTDWNLLRFNCCDCVEQTLKACGIILDGDVWPNWPVNPGAQPDSPVFNPDPYFE